MIKYVNKLFPCQVAIVLLHVHAVQSAFKPGSLSRKNCQLFRVHTSNKTCQRKLARLYGALEHFVTSMLQMLQQIVGKRNM